MENNMVPKRASWWVYAVFGLALMFINLWLANKMAEEPFHSFIIIAFLVNAVLGMGFRSVYNIIMRDNNKKERN